MDAFFNPRSVAVVGASNKPFNLAATICALLPSIGYTGSIHAVNAAGETVHGCPGYRSLLDIPGAVDLAVILIQAGRVPEVLRLCGEKGIRAVIIESAGFAEDGPGGERIQAELDAAAAHYGIRYMGPNCLGTMSSHDRFCCFFGVDTDSFFYDGMIQAGTISYVIQSGGVAGLVMDSLRHDLVGVNKVVCIGNKGDVDEADLIDYFERDRTELVGMYLENVPRGRKFFESARRAKKPILVYKVGRTEAGARAATSHTAGLANDDAIFDSACRQAGVIRVHSISDLSALPKMFTAMPPLTGRRIAVFTNTGAFGGITADSIVEAGLAMAVLSAETKARLEEVGPLYNTDNPVDMGPGLSRQGYVDICEILLKAPEVDGLLFIPSLWQPFIVDAMAELPGICQDCRKPAALYVPNALSRTIPIRKDRLIPLFDSVEEAVRALAASWTHYRAKGNGLETEDAAVSEGPSGAAGPDSVYAVL